MAAGACSSPLKTTPSLSSGANPVHPGAAVAITQDGKLTYQKGYGAANLEYDVPISPDTVFHVASVSKQFTAMSIVLLEEDGKLSLEDDIHKYLAELRDYGYRLTIRNLLQHTSGIRDQWQTLTLSTTIGVGIGGAGGTFGFVGGGGD
jgi:CubicO group peptidase (beta-lactamase class C family)